MTRDDYNPDDWIAALATPWGESALAVVRTSGNGSIDGLARVFSRPELLRRAEGGRLIHGAILDSNGGEQLDEVVLSVFRGPRSYTGQDSVDITCHGSLPGIASIQQALHSVGFRDALPGEFTLRAFIGGKMDLTRAEAVREIVESKSRKSHGLALRRLSGSVSRRIDQAKGQLSSLMAAIEVLLDYPDDEVVSEGPIDFQQLREVEELLTDLVSTYRTGRLYQEGVRVAIAGRTNAGKSSLFNLFLREDRSIVSDQHGTTRDFIESWIAVDGIPITLFDTAGLRRPEDAVESEGIRRTDKVLAGAELVLYLVDATAGMVDEDRSFLAARDRSAGCIGIWNKTDLSEEPAPEHLLPLSALTGSGFDRLEREMVTRLLGGAGPTGDTVIDSERQRDLINRCLAALALVRSGLESEAPLDGVAVDLREALDALGEITGLVTRAEVLHDMFSRFCVGK